MIHQPAKLPGFTAAFTLAALVVLAAALMLPSTLTACTTSRWQTGPISGANSLALADAPGYRIAKCAWYTDDEALLALWLFGEEPRLLLARCDMHTGRVQQNFDAPFTMDWEDDLLVAPDLLGYQNALNTVTFDRGDLTPAARYAAQGDNIQMRSDDLRYVAEIAPDDLTITGAQSPNPIVCQLSANATLRWSADGASAVCISSDRTAVHLLDLASGTHRTLLVGKDIPMPGGFVELMYCRLLPDGKLLLDAAGEQDAPLILLDIADPGQVHVVAGQGEMTTLADAGSTALYCLRDRSGGLQQLFALDCMTRETSLIFETASEILCASFSADDTRVLIGLYSGVTGNSLVVCPLR